MTENTSPTDPLPADLAKPRRDPESIRMWVGIVVGGVLMAVTAGLLVLAAVLP